jgi:hypothetical protein
MKPLRSILLVLIFAIPASAQVSRIDANAPFPITNKKYLVIALPSNYKSDPNSMSLVKAFNPSPFESDVTIYWYWPERPCWADWKHRFQKRIPDNQLPVVLGMWEDQVLFKQSKANFDSIVGGVSGRRRPLLDVFFPRCPGPNCPQPNEPYQPDSPYTPDSPLQPIPDTPTVPDTPIPDTPQEPVGPDPELLAIIADLQVRIEVLEVKIAQAGPAGPKGDKGDKGDTGKDGVSPVLDYEKIVAEIAKRLTHSLEVTLLSGKKQFQEKPLSEPLEINQRTVSAK